MKLIKKMCEWIVKELGPDVPLHFSRFFPMYQMSDLEPTHIETLEKAKKIAEDAGIHYVYVGNVPKAENTVCPKCKKVLIRRFGYEIAFNELKNGKCPSCNEKIAGVWK
jgi:pyruvate formate lyase activating enzyme